MPEGGEFNSWARVGLRDLFVEIWGLPGISPSVLIEKFMRICSSVSLEGWPVSRVAVVITLSDAERRELEGLARRRKTAQGLARRARIVLAAADGLENKAIVERVGADANTVGKWRRRFAERGLDGLYDEPRPGAPRKIGDEQIAEVIARTLEETPPRGDALEPALDVSRLRVCALDDPSHLAGLRPAAAPLGDLLSN